MLIKFFSLSTMLGIAHAAFAAGYDITCPLEAPPLEIKFINTPQPWVGYVYKGNLKLSAAGIMGNSPETLEDLKPYDIKETKKQSIVTWKLEGPFFKTGKWLSCDYGDKTVSLSKRLPDEINECSVIYTKGREGWPDYIKIKCK